jgi:pimeloyl-ACP methyl ester carboxylesterase
MKIYYIPGLGADLRLFNPMLPQLPGKEILWPKVLGKSLEDLAKQIIEINQIKESDLIIGFSFGAQIAKEIKLLIPNIKVVGISSVMNSDELTFSFKLYARIAKWVPNFILKRLILAFGIKHATQNSRDLTKDDISLLKKQSLDLNMDFFKRTLNLCACWQNNKKAPILQINGEFDTVIPYDKNKCDVVVQEAGHLITYTHADVLVQEIKKYAKI